MLKLVTSLDKARYSPRVYVVADTDSMSGKKAMELEKGFQPDVGAWVLCFLNPGLTGASQGMWVLAFSVHTLQIPRVPWGKPGGLEGGWEWVAGCGRRWLEFHSVRVWHECCATQHPTPSAIRAPTSPRLTHLQGKQKDCDLYAIPRSRHVGQSYFTSIFTTLRSMLYGAAMVWQLKPDVVSTCWLLLELLLWGAVGSARLSLLGCKHEWIEGRLGLLGQARVPARAGAGMGSGVGYVHSEADCVKRAKSHGEVTPPSGHWESQPLCQLARIVKLLRPPPLRFPAQLIINGPGTCIPLALAAFVYK